MARMLVSCSLCCLVFSAHELLIISPAIAQEQFTKQALIDTLRRAIRPTAQFDTLSISGTIRIKDKNSPFESQTVLSPRGGSIASIGTPSSVSGFNPDYAFRLTKRDDSDKAHWSVSLIAFRSVSPDLYETIKGSVSAQPGTLLEQANVSSTRLVLDLLERAEVQLVEQKALETGQVELKFANSPEATKAIAAYDERKKKEAVPKNPPSTEPPPPSAAEKRPTEIKVLRCVVEPSQGYLVSELEITTAFFDGKTMTYRDSASEFQKVNGVWYPKVYSYTRETGDYLESGNKEVIELENAGRSSTETAYLRHYGLPEPELSRRFSSLAVWAAGILLLLGLVVWAIKLRR
ncbi:MAG: hypothetical protein ACKO81_05415 [Planctomycetota bacterium]